MYITKAKDAVQYLAPGHNKMQMHRIQGQDVSPLNAVWSARLSLEPGGCVESKGSPAGKLYIVESGEIEFTGGDQTVLIQKGDSVFVLPNEARSFKEARGNEAIMYLVILENYISNN